MSFSSVEMNCASHVLFLQANLVSKVCHFISSGGYYRKLSRSKNVI